jgi:hypothetical protein
MRCRYGRSSWASEVSLQPGRGCPHLVSKISEPLVYGSNVCIPDVIAVQRTDHHIVQAAHAPKRGQEMAKSVGVSGSDPVSIPLKPVGPVVPPIGAEEGDRSIQAFEEIAILRGEVRVGHASILPTILGGHQEQ